MTRIGPLGARRRHAHPMQSEMDRRFWPDHGAVFDVDEFNLGARRRRGGSSLRRGLWKGGRREKKAPYECDRAPSHSPHRRSPMILARCAVIFP